MTVFSPKQKQKQKNNKKTPTLGQCQRWQRQDIQVRYKGNEES